MSRELDAPKEGAWIRRLPLVSLTSFAVLSLGLVWIYESSLAWYPACFTPGIGIVCVSVSPIWLPLAALWGSSAVAVAALMGAQKALARRGRTLGTPSGFLLAFGAIVSVLGLVWLSTAPWAGPIGSGGGAEFALHVGYVTAALFLFAVTFVDFDPDKLPSRNGLAILALVNVALALTTGLAWPL